MPWLAGKDVYCEKPMSHTVADGLEMVKAVQSGKRMFQCGSQRVSNILYKKAAEIYASGRLGEVHYIQAHCDRNSPSGAWVYPIAPDASPQTIDWPAFLRDAPERPFDPVRFFRWRCFADYGEGLAGDLFVHLLSGIQFVSGINAVPSRALSSGSLTHFNDGRDFPDLLVTFYDYPGVTVNLHCNQNNEAGEATIFYGKEATMTINGNTLTVAPQDTTPRSGGLLTERLDRGREAAISGRVVRRSIPAADREPAGGGNLLCAARLRRHRRSSRQLLPGRGDARACGGGRGLRQQCRNRMPHGESVVFPSQRGHVGRGIADDQELSQTSAALACGRCRRKRFASGFTASSS